jgi:hypothetical protein
MLLSRGVPDMTRVRSTFFAVALAALALIPALHLAAQTSLYSTTLNAALTAPTQGSPQLQINLASATNVAVGQGLVVDGEYMTIQSATPTTTIWNVVRGQSGTQASAHVSGSAVLFGDPNNFYFNSRQPSGYCVSTLNQATPRVVVSTSTSIFLCPATSTLAGSPVAQWAQITDNGQPYNSGFRWTGYTYVTLGALVIQPGVSYIGSSGALAMTLAAPSKYMDGLVMVIQASTAQAHTVTYTAGFYGNTTSSDVATFGGAIGDNLVIFATGGAWRPVSTRNVTFG